MAKYIAVINHLSKNGMVKAGDEVEDPSQAHLTKGLVKEVKVKEPKEVKETKAKETKAKKK